MRVENAEAVEEPFREYMKIKAPRRERILERFGDENSDIDVAEVEDEVVDIAHQVYYTIPLHGGDARTYFSYMFRSRLEDKRWGAFFCKKH